MNKIKVHLGCGLITPAGWINIDGSLNALLSKWSVIRKILKMMKIIPSSLADISWDKNILVHDVRKKLPFQDNTISIIYTSHLLEHLYLSEAKSLLKDCYRVLTDGGILRVVVPDLKSVIMNYIRNDMKSQDDEEGDNYLPRAVIFMKKLLMYPENPPCGNLIYRIYTFIEDFHTHKWQYDSDSLLYYFEQAGFTNVRECGIHDSLIPDIDIIEQKDRVLDGEGICIEGIK